ncbi:MAG: glutathione S-transferase family protein [Pyruvatibacter sp.]
MLKLLGFPASNYYNMVKMALMEKGAAYEDVRVYSGSKEEFLSKSAMGKVPCLETPDGFLTETSVILDYIEDAVDGPSFYPADPYERARVRELVKYSELYLELPARRCYGEAFFGTGPVSQEVKDSVRPVLERGCSAIKRRGRFTPYLAGDTLTYADMVFLHSFPMAASVAHSVFDWNLTEELPQAQALLEHLNQRPVVAQIAEDTKQGMKEFRKAYGMAD